MLIYRFSRCFVRLWSQSGHKIIGGRGDTGTTLLFPNSHNISNRNKQYSLLTINIGTALDIDDEQHYIINMRYCDARIESILLEVNNKENTES